MNSSLLLLCRVSYSSRQAGPCLLLVFTSMKLRSLLIGHLIANKASPHAAVDSMPAFLQKAKDDAAEEAAKKMKILPSLAATRMATGASPFTPGYPLKLLNEVPAIGSLTPVSALDAADLAQVKPKRRLST